MIAISEPVPCRHPGRARLRHRGRACLRRDAARGAARPRHGRGAQAQSVGEAASRAPALRGPGVRGSHQRRRDRRHGPALGHRGGRGRSRRAAARPAGRRARPERRRRRLGADAACDRGGRAARPPGDPAGWRRGLLRTLRLLGREDRPASPCPDRSSGIACWRWSSCRARWTARRACSRRPAAGPSAPALQDARRRPELRAAGRAPARRSCRRRSASCPA